MPRDEKRKKVWLDRIDGERRQEADFYPTDPRTIQVALMSVARDRFEPLRILDPGAGEGRWGGWARKRWAGAHITGAELREVPAHSAYDIWLTGCFLKATLAPPYDLVIGNPPYRHAEEFVRRSLGILQEGGRLIFLLPTSFQASQGRGRGLWKENNLRWINACIRRPSFQSDNKTNATDFALYTWEKGWRSGATWGTTAEWEDLLSRRGRPRIYANRADRDAAYRERKRQIKEKNDGGG